jgi:hypothetical protein
MGANLFPSDYQLESVPMRYCSLAQHFNVAETHADAGFLLLLVLLLLASMLLPLLHIPGIGRLFRHKGMQKVSIQKLKEFRHGGM